MSYQVWIFTEAGAKTAYLENAYGIQRSVKANQTPTLSFSLPVDDAKADYITSAYEIKIYNTVKARWEGLYILDDAEEKWDGSGSVIIANYSGVMGQLAQEDNITYDTTSTPKTPTQIITALLALQENTNPITVGTIQPTTSFAYAVENINLLAAILKCANECLGGYIEVDADRKLNWYNEPSGDPVREVRYQKNLRGVSRKRDFTGIINKLYAYGYGETEAQVTLVDAGEDEEYIEDATSQTAYGVRIKRITDKRITHPSTLLLWAQRVLALYKDPVYYYSVDVVNLAEHPDFTFDLENLEVGQIVRVVNSDLNDLNVDVKIVSVETQLDRPENITLELANATKTLADSIGSVQVKTSLAENIAVQIGAGQVTVLGTFTVEDWTSAGVTTIDGGNITTNTLAADAIKTSTLNAKTITLGTTGGDSIIKSGNYSAGSAGWQIKANGDAEFNNVTVRGTIGTASIGTGATITTTGTIQSSNFDSGAAGWRLYGGASGASDFHDINVSGTISNTELISTPDLYLINTSTSKQGRIYIASDGMSLKFRDHGGTEHTITIS